MILASLFAASVCFSPSRLIQESVPFTRTYKVGEQSTYTVTGTVGIAGAGSTTVDIGLTVAKLLENGRAQIRTHMSNQQVTGSMQAATLPGDKVVALSDHNMPSSIGMTGVEEFLLFLFIANSTVDKPVKAGEEYPWTWKGGAGTDKSGQTLAIGLDGSTKVLEISSEKKQLKALIKLKMQMNGTEAGAFTFTSIYNLADLSLVQSVGKFEFGASTIFDFKIAKKS
jgi:hypothetical protein